MNMVRRGRPAEGEVIYVPAYGACEVLAHIDPSVVRLRTASGTELKIGERALALALLAHEDREGGHDG